MEIGQHSMEGKVVELPEPFLVLKNDCGNLSTCGVVSRKRMSVMIAFHLLALTHVFVQWFSRLAPNRSSNETDFDDSHACTYHCILIKR